MILLHNLHILHILNDIVSGGEDVEGDPARFHLRHPPRGTSQSWFRSVFVFYLFSFLCFCLFVFSLFSFLCFSDPAFKTTLGQAFFSVFFFIAGSLGLRLIVLFVLQMFLSLVLGLV